MKAPERKEVTPNPPLTWPMRVLLTGWTVGGTALFGWTYVLAQAPALSPRVAGPIALGMFMAWPLFALVLALGARGVPLVNWADTCLRTTGTGAFFLVLCTTLQILVPTLPGRVHLALILSGGLTMTLTFVLEGAALGLTWRRALKLWVLGLQAPFLLMFYLMRGFR